jgi:uncharacterized membrane-anchored protein
MATTVGETAADFLNTRFDLGLTNTSLIMGALLLMVLVGQFRAHRYVPWLYWVVVLLVSVVGTLITDNLSDNFGVIHTIFTTRRERFYWAAILFTFALGTAAGDLMAETLELGYFHSALIFGAGIAAVTLAYYAFKLNAVLAFWIAYILTRPFGASFGDLLSQPPDNGGLGLGTVGTSAAFLVVIFGLIAIMTVAQRRAAFGPRP